MSKPTFYPAPAHPPTPNHNQPIVATTKEPMTKFDKAVTSALAACPIERKALDEAAAKADGLHSERGQIQAAIAKRQAEPETTETRIIHGVPVEVQSSNRRDDIAALARRRDQLPELFRVASEQRESARRKLSRAVAAKLADAQAELQKRTEQLIEMATALCKDADALELAMQSAGLDPESVYACRFQAVQDLRADQQSYGADILRRLREVA